MKNDCVRILKILLRKIRVTRIKNNIILNVSRGKESFNIPTFLGDNISYRKILLPILQRIPEEEVIEIKLPNMKSAIRLRTQTSDILTFRQIFFDKDYDLRLNKEPKLIIDGGANVGHASIFFANQFPNAKIIAVEPEESNFQILKENASSYQNIEVIKSGIWNKRKYLKVKDIGIGKWGMVVEEVNSGDQGSFKAVTIGDLLKRSGYEEIDILKLDIEGAEKEVFHDNYEEWLGKVSVLIIELHDRIKPGCSETFCSAIGRYSFHQIQRGENIILIKNGDDLI